jgi:CheY-like chemotaxis protein
VVEVAGLIVIFVYKSLLMDPLQPFIIVVDDDEDDQYLFNYCFREMGLSHHVRFFSDAVQFLKYADLISSLSARPSLIILDYKMPGMNGNAVVEYLKGLHEFADVPLVILTTIISEEKKQRLLKMGVRACYKKGMNYQELKAELQEIVGYAIPAKSQ